ncbi:MAG: threonyl-tRNA synthetase editing domain-containing protein [Nitrospirota bacterium]
MKILMFYAPSFWYKTYEKVLADVPDREIEESCDNAVVVFYHAEEADVERKSSVLTKFIKNVKWLSGKFNTRNLVLHSFNHLSSSKAPADFTAALISEARERLLNTGFTIVETPFGYLNEWKIHVAGDSLAKVFKEL